MMYEVRGIVMDSNRGSKNDQMLATSLRAIVQSDLVLKQVARVLIGQPDIKSPPPHLFRSAQNPQPFPWKGADRCAMTKTILPARRTSICAEIRGAANLSGP
jgi:hypothetical protein